MEDDGSSNGNVREPNVLQTRQKDNSDATVGESLDAKVEATSGQSEPSELVGNGHPKVQSATSKPAVRATSAKNSDNDLLEAKRRIAFPSGKKPSSKQKKEVANSDTLDDDERKAQTQKQDSALLRQEKQNIAFPKGRSQTAINTRKKGSSETNEESLPSPCTVVGATAVGASGDQRGQRKLKKSGLGSKDSCSLPDRNNGKGDNAMNSPGFVAIENVVGASAVAYNRGDQRGQRKFEKLGLGPDDSLNSPGSASSGATSSPGFVAIENAVVSGKDDNKIQTRGLTHGSDRLDRIRAKNNNNFGTVQSDTAPEGDTFSNELLVRDIASASQTKEQQDVATSHLAVDDPQFSVGRRANFNTTHITQNHEGLAIANMVTEPSTRNLPCAKEMDEGEQAELERGRAQKTKRIAILGVLFAIVVIAIVLVIVLLVVPKEETIVVANTTLSPTQAPSQAPTSIESYLLSLFPSKTVLKIEQPGSSQALAFDWILQNTTYILQLSDDRIKQRFALAAFYFATNGDKWNHNGNWLNHSVHECLWESLGSFDNFVDGITWLEVDYNTTCEIDPEVELPILDDGLFQHVWMPLNNVEGELPPEFFWLTGLRSINLDANRVAGAFLGEISEMSNLEVFSLGGNGLTGSIPVEITEMTNLTAITIQYNALIGTIPTEIGLLTNLKYLLLDENSMLSGSFPTEIGQLTNMIWLYLHNNPLLTGTIPTELGMLQEMQMLTMSTTATTGSIPSELGLLGQVMYLWLHTSYLTGTLPSELGQLTNVVDLLLFVNQLSGEMPTELGLLENVLWLELDVNSLTGTIPAELGQLSSVLDITLFVNQLSGEIPTELGLLETVGRLWLSDNQLTGSLPVELGFLASQGSLEVLRLTGNDLTGVVPEALCFINETDFDCNGNLCGCDCQCSANGTMSPSIGMEDGDAAITMTMTSVPSSDGIDSDEPQTGNNSGAP